MSFQHNFSFTKLTNWGKKKIVGDCCKLVPRLQLPKLMSFFLYQFLWTIRSQSMHHTPINKLFNETIGPLSITTHSTPFELVDHSTHIKRGILGLIVFKGTSKWFRSLFLAKNLSLYPSFHIWYETTLYSLSCCQYASLLFIFALLQNDITTNFSFLSP